MAKTADIWVSQTHQKPALGSAFSQSPSALLTSISGEKMSTAESHKVTDTAPPAELFSWDLRNKSGMKMFSSHPVLYTERSAFHLEAE